MLILLDECVPRPLAREFSGHHVVTVRDLKWHGIRNSALLQAMQAQGIEVLVTVDQSLRYQQNVAAFGAAIVVLVAVSNRLDSLLPLMPAVQTALANIRPGMVLEISAP
jgi:hypothetical protein